jgi:hypothetical protein
MRFLVGVRVSFAFARVRAQPLRIRVAGSETTTSPVPRRNPRGFGLRGHHILEAALRVRGSVAITRLFMRPPFSAQRRTRAAKGRGGVRSGSDGAPRATP